MLVPYPLLIQMANCCILQTMSVCTNPSAAKQVLETAWARSPGKTRANIFRFRESAVNS